MSESGLHPLTQPGTIERAQESPDETILDSGGDSRSVVIHNDDVTPFDYVIGVLMGVFLLSEELADHIAWTAHTKGCAVVVVRPRPDAERLAKIANGRGRMDGYPLTFTLESE